MSEDSSNRAMPDGFASWPDYWKAHGMPWRMEPEIGEVRQKFLSERRAIESDIKAGIYPYRSIELNRADVEWLLATHKSAGMQGPINGEDPTQRFRIGLDLRAAHLSGVDLRSLPLVGLRGGLAGDEWRGADDAQRAAAAIYLDGANLTYSDLRRSVLNHAHLRGANLRECHLEEVELFGANLEPTSLPVDLRWAYLDGKTILANAVLANKQGISCRLADVHWNGANLSQADWSTVRVAGDEFWAKQRRLPAGQESEKAKRERYYNEAVRAYRQLAIILRSQGLNEDADRFAYRAQRLHRLVLRRHRRYLHYVGSSLLDL